MICKGKLTRADINNQISIVNSDGLEIYCGSHHISAPEKLVIHGCDDKYNYLGELLKQNNKDIFTISEHDVVIVKIERLPSLIIPKCKIWHRDHKFTVKFSAKGGKSTMQLLDSDEDVASISFIKNNYEIIIKDDQNPTLLAAILIGISEVNKLADRALSRV